MSKKHKRTPQKFPAALRHRRRTLTEEQEELDVSQFFDPDAPSGEPVLEQIRDPFNGSVHTPGLEVTEDGKVLRKDPERRI